MIRLLVLGPLPPPVGGVETVTRAILDSPAFAEFDLRHCDTTKARPKHTQGKFDIGNCYWALIHFSRMAKAVYSHKPQVVYMPLTATWSGFWRDVVLASIGRLGKAKIVGHVHAGWFGRLLKARGFVGWAVRRSLSLFDALLMLGEVWRAQLAEYGYQGKLYVVPPTYSAEVYREASRYMRQYDTSHATGLFVGHVGRNKGVLDLLEAIARLGPLIQRFVVVGPPQFVGDWEEVMARTKSLGLGDRVSFTGQLQGKDLYDMFRSCDYLVLPSYAEGLPVVFLEAGNFGLPVIGTPVGAVPELLKNGVNGLLVSPGDVAALSAAIKRLHTNSAERRRLGARLRDDIGAFHPDVVCAKAAGAIVDAMQVPTEARPKVPLPDTVKHGP